MTGSANTITPTPLSKKLSYEVEKLSHGASNKTDSSDSTPLTKEIKVDKVILSWIFTALSDALQNRLVIACPKSAKEACDLITDIVKVNKCSCTNALKSELRSIKLGDSSMEAYFMNIESILTTLASLGSQVNDKDVVHYALEGLLTSMIKSLGLCTLKTVFRIEMRLKSKSLLLPVDSSSPLVLMTQTVLLVGRGRAYDTNRLGYLLKVMISAVKGKLIDSMFNHLRAPLEGKCLQVARPILDYYKKGKKTTEIYDLQLIMCGDMFKKILSQGEALKIVSYMKTVL
ncbi:hypothetical protein Tco_0017814 [Tanacetum coccineum]